MKARAMSLNELSLRLGNWVEGFEQPVQLVSDSPLWDWPWIQELFCLPGTWPENLDGKPTSLYANKVNTTIVYLAIEQGFSAGLRRHHALDDAKANRLGWLAANETKLSVP
ncbi:MAG: 3'-5' exoribonuclease [Gallionella sp.]|nr:3'-5' exoribonuclease [Gallionella sp.]